MADTRRIKEPRTLAHLGFTRAVNLSASPNNEYVLIWNDSGSLCASGTPAAKLAATATLRGEEAAPHFNPGPFAAPPPPAAAPVTTMPQPGETPNHWLFQLLPGAEAAVRDVVLASQLSGTTGALWAAFAQSMGWEVPLVPVAAPEPDVHQQTTATIPAVEAIVP